MIVYADLSKSNVKLEYYSLRRVVEPFTALITAGQILSNQNKESEFHPPWGLQPHILCVERGLLLWRRECNLIMCVYATWYASLDHIRPCSQATRIHTFLCLHAAGISHNMCAYVRQDRYAILWIFGVRMADLSTSPVMRHTACRKSCAGSLRFHDSFAAASSADSGTTCDRHESRSALSFRCKLSQNNATSKYLASFFAGVHGAIGWRWTTTALLTDLLV